MTFVQKNKELYILADVLLNFKVFLKKVFFCVLQKNNTFLI